MKYDLRITEIWQQKSLLIGYTHLWYGLSQVITINYKCVYKMSLPLCPSSSSSSSPLSPPFPPLLSLSFSYTHTYIHTYTQCFLKIKLNSKVAGLYAHMYGFLTIIQIVHFAELISATLMQ